MSEHLNNDAGAAYTAYRAQLPAATAGDDLLREMQQAQTATKEGAQEGATKGATTVPATVPQKKESGGVMKNFAESGPAVYAGVHDAVAQAYGAISSFNKYLSSKTGLPTFQDELASVGVHTDPIEKGLDKTQAGEPTTPFGGAVKGVSQFVTGLALTRGMIPELPAAGAAAKYTLGALHGAAANFAAFDPHQQRLSDLIDKYPALRNPVTEYLQSDPKDSEAEGRFKNALEGLGLGATTDAFLSSVRLLRATGEAKAAVGKAPAEAPAPAANEDAFRLLGDARQAPDAPILQPKSPVPGMHADELQGGAPKQTYINFARIDAPEDIQRTMQEIADARHGEIEGAARGTQTFEQIKLNAAQQNAWNILKARNVGEPLNAEQSVAARQLWGASAAKLTELAQVATQTPTPENLFAFRKMLATHSAIQAQVIGARTETARALASWRIPTGTPEGRLAEITSQLNENGGTDATREIAGRVLQLANSADPQAPAMLSKFVERSTGARTRDAVIQAVTDGLLTAATTTTKIMASNVTTAFMRMAERGIGASISKVLGTPQGIAAGEAGAMWAGWIGGAKDGLAYAGKAFRTGVTGEGIGLPHSTYPSYVSSESLPWMGRAADYLGTTLGIGRKLVAAQHDMALTMAYRGELNALAHRQVMSELADGSLDAAGAADRKAELLAHPPDDLVKQAQDSARYQAFLDKPGQDTIGKLTNWVLQGRQQVPAMRLIAPFIKIPSRILSYTFERTPLALLSSEFYRKVGQGGAVRDEALGRLAMGTLLTSTAADMVYSGNLKGGGPPQKGIEQAQEREGQMRDSLRVGNSWYNINGVHPIGKIVLLAADVAEAIRGGQQELHDDGDTEKLVAGTSLAIARTLTDSTYMKGFADLFATLHDAKIGGSGESALLSLAGEAVPAGVASADRATDPYQRAVYSMLDEFKSKIPGLSEKLPPRRDLWGEPVPNGHDPLTIALSPVQFKNEQHSPIDDEILKQGFNLTMPDRRQTFGDKGNSVAIDMAKYPQAYSRLLELSGHELKSPAWGVGLKDLLDQIVSGHHPLSDVYKLKSDGPEGGKEVMIRDLMSQYRDLSKRQLLEEFPALQSEVQSKAAAQQALKLQP